MHFFIFQPENKLKFYLIFNESQPIYASKRYAYKKECDNTLPLHYLMQRSIQDRVEQDRSSHRRFSVKKGVPKNVAIFTGKTHVLETLLNNVANLGAFLRKQFQGQRLLKKRLQHRCLPVNIAKFLGTPFLKNICERLILTRERFVQSVLKCSCLREREEFHSREQALKHCDSY